MLKQNIVPFFIKKFRIIKRLLRFKMWGKIPKVSIENFLLSDFNIFYYNILRDAVKHFRYVYIQYNLSKSSSN